MFKLKTNAFDCCLTVSLVLILLLAFNVGSKSGDPASGIASSIVADLRSMKNAVLLFRSESRDEVARWASLPNGVTSVDAPQKYLARYWDQATGYADPGHAYRFDVTSGDGEPLWRVACVIPDYISSHKVYKQYTNSEAGVRHKLKMRAKPAGLVNLLNADGTPYSGGDVVYMIVSFGLEARGEGQ